MARNNMQGMKVGDQAFFYHSSCKEPGCVGICEVAVEAAVDASASAGSLPLPLLPLPGSPPLYFPHNHICRDQGAVDRV